MSFKDMVAADNHTTFLNLGEYGEKRIVIYDGVTYDGDDHDGIPVVLSGLKEKDRRQLMSDHIQGLYLVSAVLHCAISDLGGKQPEKGTRIKISTRPGGSFFRTFYVAASVCDLGMLRVELEALDE